MDGTFHLKTISLFQVGEDGKLTGLTGRTLTVPTEWSESNVNGKKFRVGCKKIFSLYPKVLKDQVHKHRLDKLWSTSHKQNLAKVTNDIEAFEVRNIWIFLLSIQT